MNIYLWLAITILTAACVAFGMCLRLIFEIGVRQFVSYTSDSWAQICAVLLVGFLFIGLGYALGCLIKYFNP